jgi:hypothetical protein
VGAALFFPMCAGIEIPSVMKASMMWAMPCCVLFRECSLIMDERSEIW